MKIKPLHDWAVLKTVDVEEKTPGGLYVPDSAKQKSQKGIVEAIGPGSYEDEYKWKKKKKQEQQERKFIPTMVKPGQTVLFEKYLFELEENMNVQPLDFYTVKRCLALKKRLIWVNR